MAGPETEVIALAANRLFLMVYYLLEKGTVTAPKLADHFEVSVRTIYRDIDILSAAGIPVYTKQGKGGGISIQENFVLNRSLLSEQEQTQILLALQGMEVVDNENTDTVLSKLSNIFQKQNVNWIEVDYTGWNRDGDKYFNTLKDAIFQSKRVAFLYYGTNGEASDRTVEPLKLVFKSREWYLYAYCCIRCDFRFFKLTRIKNLVITEQDFRRSAPSQVFQQTNPYKEPTITLTLLFDQSMSYSVYDHFDKVTKREDGSFSAEICLPQNEWLYDFILSFGDKAEVLAPQSVREEIKMRIENMQNKYIT